MVRRTHPSRDKRFHRFFRRMAIRAWAFSMCPAAPFLCSALDDSRTCCAQSYTMATRGVFQLSKLRIHYCDIGGSSRGARDFIKQHVVKFANETPAAEIQTVMKRGRHPFLFGEYLDGTHKMITVKNLTPKEIEDYAMMLKNSSSGRVRIFVGVFFVVFQSSCFFMDVVLCGCPSGHVAEKGQLRRYIMLRTLRAPIMPLVNHEPLLVRRLLVRVISPRGDV